MENTRYKYLNPKIHTNIKTTTQQHNYTTLLTTFYSKIKVVSITLPLHG